MRSYLSGLVVLHDKFEWTQKVLLEVEVLKLTFLQKLERQLSENVIIHRSIQYKTLFPGYNVLKNTELQ
jgi:hypothetical protein